MKIRWTNNSVRFRITPGELESMQNNFSVEEELFDGSGGWVARISIGGDAAHLEFLSGILLVYLSPTNLETLADPQNEGVYFSTGGENSIRYFIEKDFPCAHPRAGEAGETPTETFESPRGFEERKNRPAV